VCEVKEGYLQSGVFELRYQIEGEGIPAIVIGSSMYYPSTFSQELRKTFQFVFLDHKGFVPTEKPVTKEQYKLEAILEDVELARVKLGLGKIAIIGHSGHGFMALEYAKKYPNVVSHIILIGMGPSNSEENHHLSNEYFNDSVSPERKAILENDMGCLSEELKNNPERAFITFCLRLGARSWYNPTYDAKALWEGVQVNMPIIDYLWGEVFRDIDITKNLNLLEAPIFLALGIHDYLVAPFYTWQPLRNQFENLTIKLFEKSGHSPQLEEAALFDSELKSWLLQNADENSKKIMEQCLKC
jgi:proline iminopeptidase